MMRSLRAQSWWRGVSQTAGLRGRISLESDLWFLLHFGSLHSETARLVQNYNWHKTGRKTTSFTFYMVRFTLYTSDVHFTSYIYVLRFNFTFYIYSYISQNRRTSPRFCSIILIWHRILLYFEEGRISIKWRLSYKPINRINPVKYTRICSVQRHPPFCPRHKRTDINI